jgi:hypothetical protein
MLASGWKPYRLICKVELNKDRPRSELDNWKNLRGEVPLCWILIAPRAEIK